MRQLGFRQRGVWRGTVRFVNEPKRQRDLHIRFVARVLDVVTFFRSGKVPVVGHISLEQFMKDVPFEGTLKLQPLQHQVTVMELTFKDPLQTPTVLRGETRVEWLHLRDTLPRFLIRLEQAGEVIALGSMSLEVRDIPSWLASLEPTFREP